MAKETVKALVDTLEKLSLRQQEGKLEYYKPYPKQLMFHKLGATMTERCLMAANRSGKTFSAAMEVAMHASGEYPEWWEGRRFGRAVKAWVSGVTSESVRETIQDLLLGPVGAFGTGTIPKKSIVDVRMGKGVADGVDMVLVKHKSGGTSVISFKAYEKGRTKWQGSTLDFIWFDEEPPSDIYFEGLTRVATTKGFVMMTFTPLLGMSEVVQRYMNEYDPGRAMVSMTLEDVQHFTREEREAVIARWRPHEREARARGLPMLGEGKVFQVPEGAIEFNYNPNDNPFPAHYAHIVGLDFGIAHPFAAVWMAWDRDSDCLYVYDTYRVEGMSAVHHAVSLNRYGRIPVAWPHDGNNRDKGSGETLAGVYRRHGVNMLANHATFVDGGNSFEAGIEDMRVRMETGKFKVAKHLKDWWEEFRQYHRKDGQVVKLKDDLLSATRYGLMMRRYAVVTAKIMGARNRMRKSVQSPGMEGYSPYEILKA